MSSNVNQVHEIEVRPDSGNHTRLQRYQQIVKGMPDFKPSEPKVTKNKGDKLRVSSTHKVSKSDLGDGVVHGADGRSFYFVTDDPINGEAAKLFIKQSDAQVLKTGVVYTVIPGDSLVKIAEGQHFGKKLNGVDIIYEANKDVIGVDKDLIQPGQKLFIPNFSY
jgi:nucleoid-associated protein YgaU